MSKLLPERTTFLNVDLDLQSRYDLQPLIEALSPVIEPLGVWQTGRTHCAFLELVRQPKNADSAIRKMAGVINGLPRAKRKLWDATKSRIFNVGIEAGMTQGTYVEDVSPETVTLVSKLGAHICFTVYSRGPSTGSNQRKRRQKARGKSAEVS